MNPDKGIKILNETRNTGGSGKILLAYFLLINWKAIFSNRMKGRLKNKGEREMEGFKKQDTTITFSNESGKQSLNLKEDRFLLVHPAWYSLIKYCESLRYGEIEKLKIQDGLPMIAEVVKKKINFSKGEKS